MGTPLLKEDESLVPEATPVARWKFIGATLIFMAAALGALWWAAVAGSEFWDTLQVKPPNIEYDNAFVFMSGIGVGLLAVVVAFVHGAVTHNGPVPRWFVTVVATGIFGGLAITVLAPPVVTALIDDHLKAAGYNVCKEASHRWLMARTVVYVQPQPGLCEQLATRRPAHSM